MLNHGGHPEPGLYAAGGCLFPAAASFLPQYSPAATGAVHDNNRRCHPTTLDAGLWRAAVPAPFTVWVLFFGASAARGDGGSILLSSAPRRGGSGRLG